MFKRKRDVKTLTIEELEKSATKGHKEAQKELARRLLEGDDVDKDEAKAVSLLEDCVDHGDAVAMVMLAKCCALGHGMEYNAERAESLVSEAAEKGNHEARLLLQLINDCKGNKTVTLESLQINTCLFFFFFTIHLNSTTETMKDCGRIESVVFLLSIIPCTTLTFKGEHKRKLSKQLY